MRNFGVQAIKCGLYQSFDYAHLILFKCLCEGVYECIECVCGGTSTFYYANSPWTLVSMKIIKIGMTCKVVYFSLYSIIVQLCFQKTF